MNITLLAGALGAAAYWGIGSGVLEVGSQGQQEAGKLHYVDAAFVLWSVNFILILFQFFK